MDNKIRRENGVDKLDLMQQQLQPLHVKVLENTNKKYINVNDNFVH